MNLYGLYIVIFIWGYKIPKLEFQSTVLPLIIKHNCLPLIAQLPTPPLILPQQPFFAQREKCYDKKYFFFRLEKSSKSRLKYFRRNNLRKIFEKY